VADAKWLSDRLKDAPEAKNQIAFADVIILNKIDLVTAEELDAVEARIRAINPYAKIHRTENCQVPIADVLDRKAFDLDRIIALEPDFLEEGHHHHHDEEMQSVSVRHAGEVDPESSCPGSPISPSARDRTSCAARGSWRFRTSRNASCSRAST
jgi:G3E family GTPase